MYVIEVQQLGGPGKPQGKPVGLIADKSQAEQAVRKINLRMGTFALARELTVYPDADTLLQHLGYK